MPAKLSTPLLLYLPKSSQYFGRLTHPVMKGPKRQARGATQTFPGLDASAMYQGGFPLLVTRNESQVNAVDKINRWTSGGVGGESIMGVDDVRKTSGVRTERRKHLRSSAVGPGREYKSLPDRTRNLGFRFRPNIIFENYSVVPCALRGGRDQKTCDISGQGYS